MLKSAIDIVCALFACVVYFVSILAIGVYILYKIEVAAKYKLTK